MEELKTLRLLLDEMLRSQRLAVLSTAGPGGAPYSNLVSFAALDPARLLFATTRATRKYGNLKLDARVALLVDNRQNEEADFHAALAAIGKFPYLEDFVRAPSCAFFRVDVTRYIVVTRFQNVVEILAAP
jgi:hypothetical protein